MITINQPKSIISPEIERKLEKQFNNVVIYHQRLYDQLIIAKIYHCYSNSIWYLITQNPNEPDALICLFLSSKKIHFKSVCKSELIKLGGISFNCDFTIPVVSVKNALRMFEKGEIL